MGSPQLPYRSSPRRLFPNWRGGVTGLLVLLVSLMVTTACAARPTPTVQVGAVPRSQTAVLPTPVPTPSPSPVQTRVLPPASVTPIPSAIVTPTITPIPDEATGLVVDIISGDTILVVLAGDPLDRTYQVHYLGLDAPPNEPTSPWGVVATETNQKLVGMKVVRLVSDPQASERGNNLERYVYAGNQLLNLELVEMGLAQVDQSISDIRFQSELEAAERRARDSQRGLWGPPPTATSTPAPRQPAGTATQPSPTVSATVPAATPTVQPPARATATASPSPTASPEPPVTATPQEGG